MQLFRIQMTAGDIRAARQTLSQLESAADTREASYVLALASGDQAKATELALQDIEGVQSIEVNSSLFSQTRSYKSIKCANLQSIASLLQGKPLQAYLALSEEPHTNPQEFFSSKPLVSNLATVLELVQCQDAGSDRWTKRKLLEKGSGFARDGFAPSAFKLA
jgi:hypothetical protein